MNELTTEEISQMERLYTVEHLPISKIGKLFGRAAETVSAVLKRKNIIVADYRHLTIADGRYIEDLCRQGKTVKQISTLLGKTKLHIYSYIRKHGLIRKVVYSRLNTAEKIKIKELYIGTDISMKEVSEQVGRDVTTIRAFLRSESIPTRVWIRKGADSSCWKGGEYTDTHNYVRVHSSKHPNRNKAGYVLKHRLVMEAKLGRFLEPDEYVHHKNSDRSDNRIENLELWFTTHPIGHRVIDKFKHSVSFINRYHSDVSIHEFVPDMIDLAVLILVKYQSDILINNKP